jgi:hypothetical protein
MRKNPEIGLFPVSDSPKGHESINGRHQAAGVATKRRSPLPSFSIIYG